MEILAQVDQLLNEANDLLAQIFGLRPDCKTYTKIVFKPDKKIDTRSRIAWKCIKSQFLGVDHEVFPTATSRLCDEIKSKRLETFVEVLQCSANPKLKNMRKTCLPVLRQERYTNRDEFWILILPTHENWTLDDILEVQNMFVFYFGGRFEKMTGYTIGFQSYLMLETQQFAKEVANEIE